MENLFKEFVSNYGSSILYTVITAIFGYIGIALKNLFTKYINDKTKKDVAKTCVKAIEQIYRDLHGEEKLNKCIEYVSAMLGEKGIVISEIEIRMLIEAAVREMNEPIKDLFDDGEHQDGDDSGEYFDEDENNDDYEDEEDDDSEDIDEDTDE